MLFLHRKYFVEEELKRLHQQASSSYGQVQFDYNKTDQSLSSSKESTSNENKSDEPDESYTPPANLNVPEEISTPDTMKLHAIIEKTAKFISTQGPQMEILIKAKQSNNPQFEFLNANNRLNPYYKFILDAFKKGTYPVSSENDMNQNDATKSEQQQQQQQQYLDNQLINVQSNFIRPSIPIPTIKYKPSANCTYTQLISKIKGLPLPPEQTTTEELSPSEPVTPTLLIHSSFHEKHETESDQTTAVVPPIVISTNQENHNNEKDSKEVKILKKGDGVEVKKISTGLALAQCYASDTEEENESSEPEQKSEQSELVLNFPIPPPHLQHIIDKTAAYVVKNGKEFEKILQSKEDERFVFLDSTNEYHPYYIYKVTGIVNPYPTINGIDDNIESNKSKVITPVSFSIKTKTKDENPANLVVRPALPQETSDDESESKDNKVNISQNTSVNPVTKVAVPEHVQRAIQLVESQLMSRGVQYATTIGTINTVTNVVGNTKELGQKSRFDVDNTGTVVPSRPTTMLTQSSTSSKLENTQQKELKRAEEKVKDRLAQIAREKLGLISKEKQLQLERKKKAMAFLNQIKSSGTTISTSNIKNTPSSDKSEHHRNVTESDSDSDTSSVHSIPVSSSNGNDCNSAAIIVNEKDKKIARSKSIDSTIKKEQEQHKQQQQQHYHHHTKSMEKEIYSSSIKRKQSRSHSHSRHRSIRSHSKSRSRSRSGSKRSSSHKSKKKKSKHHSKKKSKKRSRSRSQSKSKMIDGKVDSSNNQEQKQKSRRTYSPTSTNQQEDRKRKRHSSPSKKSKKKKRD